MPCSCLDCIYLITASCFGPLNTTVSSLPPQSPKSPWIPFFGGKIEEIVHLSLTISLRVMGTADRLVTP